MPEKRRTKPQREGDIGTVAIKTLIGSLVGALLFFLLTALVAVILWKTDADSEIYKYVMLFIGAISAFVCGFVAVRPIRKDGIIIGILSVLPVYIVTVIVSSLIGRSGVGIIGWILLAIQIILSAIGGIIAVNKRK